jgi:hypothetical protein
MGSRKQRFKDFILGVAAALELTLITDTIKDLGLTPEQRILAALLGLCAIYFFYKKA